MKGAGCYVSVFMFYVKFKGELESFLYLTLNTSNLTRCYKGEEMTNRIRVLVVDDKKIIGDFFDFTLGFFGHSITVVRDPREALKAAQEKPFDIAFLDIMMPERNGVDVLREIKSVMPRLPVVMMSGYSLQELKDEAMRLGASGCLKKPFEINDVRHVMKVTLGKSID